MGYLVDILIPTFNRSEFLVKNVELLISEIEKNALQNQITINISDNHSIDDTELFIQDIINNYKHLTIRYFRQKENIGLEPNVVSLMEKSTSPYVMWIGDDDLIDEGYLSFCIESIQKNDELGCIIPGLKHLYSNGTVKLARLEDFDFKSYGSGYEALLEISHLAHQMSGLLMLRKDLLPEYLKNEKLRNPYLFIFWISYCLYYKGGIYSPKFKTAVTSFNEKDWSYNQVGLIDEVFKSYLYFKDILSDTQLKNVLLRFSVLHSYRYSINWKKPVRLFKQCRYLFPLLPHLKGLKRSILIQLMKDYLRSFK